jgi:hypothetical protein
MRMIVAAELTIACFAQRTDLTKMKEVRRQFAMGKMPVLSSSRISRQPTELKWTMSIQTTRHLGATFWSTISGRVHIRCIIATLIQEISDRFPSLKNTSQTLRTDLAEIIASVCVSKEVGFEPLAQLMDAVPVSGGGDFPP